MKGKLSYFSLCLLVAVACKSESSPLSPWSDSTPPIQSGSIPNAVDPGPQTGGETSGGTDGGSISGGGNPGGGDGGSIYRFKPALAVRATGCIMCHGRVESNIITDFGHGDSFYFGAGVGLHPFAGSIYGNHAENWQTAQVNGKIFVPSAPGPNSTFPTLAEYLRAVVSPPSAGAPKPTIEEKRIFIGAPLASRLLAIAGTFPTEHPEWKVVTATNGFPMTGLQLAPGGRYVQNTPGQEFVCSGDVVVNSVLFLNELRLRTDNRGCRLYVTQSVFIQGPITYLGTASDRNLQITSSRAIVMGLGPGATSGASNTLRDRLQDFWTRAGYFTRDTSRSTQEKLDDVVLDGSYIADLKDASAQLPMRRAVGFERLFLNAPNYQSRYQGEFRGVIVAEFALASLGQFAFHFDEVFSRVPVLPLIRESEMIRVE